MIGRVFKDIVLAVIVICFFGLCGARAQCTPEPVTVVQGTVVLDSPTKSDYVAGATVIIQGDFMIVSASTDREGRFHFSNVEPGTYAVETTYFNLYAEQTITVETGGEVQLLLQLKPPSDRTSAKR